MNISYFDIDTVLKYLGNVLKSLHEQVEVLDKIFGPYVTIRININTNMTDIDIRELVQVSEMPEIVDQIIHEVGYFCCCIEYVLLEYK